jgi:hypothetical protein
MSHLKGDIINSAYSRMRISGITAQPNPEDLEVALKRVEGMAARWFKKNINAGYNFEDEPDPNTPSGLGAGDFQAYESNLAMLLLSDFGKAPHPGLVREASTTFSDLSASTASTREINYPQRQPRGRGNTLRYNRWQRFYRTQAIAPNESATNTMIVGDITDFTEHFDSYLLTDDIASFVITSDNGLTVVSSSINNADIDYRVQADGSSDGESSDGFQQVKIVMTTTAGRIETRLINFILDDQDLNP